MALLRDIAATYMAPRRAARRKLAQAPGEETLLAYVMFASLIAFCARIPALIAQADTLPSPSTFIGAQFVAAMIFGPLFLYALAALSYLLARALGGRGSGRDARLALFWVLLTMQPLVIVLEIVRYLALGNRVSLSVSLICAGVFVGVWAIFLIAAQRARS